MINIGFFSLIGGGSSEIVDGDVELFEDNVIAQSGSLQAGDKYLLQDALAELKSASIWSKLKEVTIHLGGFNGQVVKLKYVSNALLANTSFVSGDYSESIGITNSGGAKGLDFQDNPDSMGLDYQNISMGIFIVNTVGTGTIVMGTQPGSGGEEAYIGKTYLGLKGGTTQSNHADYGPNVPVFLALSCTTDRVIFKKDFHNLWPPPPNATLPSSQTFPNNIWLFRTRSFGTFVNGTGSVSFSFIGEYLTNTELQTLYTTIKDFLISKGRMTDASKHVAIGDSICFGTGASAYDKTWSYLLATAYGLRQVNMGIGGCKFVGSAAQLYSVSARQAEIDLYEPTRLTVGGPTNDARANDSRVTYQAALETFVDNRVSAGLPANMITLLSLTWIGDGTINDATQQLWNTVISNVATAKGCNYVDVWTEGQAQGVAWLQADLLHLKDVYFQYISDTVFAAT